MRTCARALTHNKQQQQTIVIKKKEKKGKSSSINQSINQSIIFMTNQNKTARGEKNFFFLNNQSINHSLTFQSMPYYVNKCCNNSVSSVFFFFWVCLFV